MRVMGPIFVKYLSKIVLLSSIVLMKYHNMCSVAGDSSERRGGAGERYGSGAARVQGTGQRHSAVGLPQQLRREAEATQGGHQTGPGELQRVPRVLRRVPADIRRQHLLLRFCAVHARFQGDRYISE